MNRPLVQYYNMNKNFLKVTILIFLLGLMSATAQAKPLLKGLYFSDKEIPADTPVKVIIKTVSTQPPITYHYKAPGNVEYTLNDGVVFWTPPPIQGEYTIMITLRDAEGELTTTRSIVVSSTGKNACPLVHANGTQLEDPLDNPLLLDGICFANNVYSDTSTLPPEPAEADYKRVKNWGANAIRFYLNARWFEQPGIWAYLEQNLRWAEKYKLYLILNIHFAPGECTADKTSFWGNTSQQNQFIKIWKSLAQHYRYRSIIAGYDLLNEPAPPHDSLWNELAWRTLEAIRGCGDQHVIFIENVFRDNTYQPFPEVIPNDPNIAYSFHTYTPTEFTLQGTSWGNIPQGAHYPYLQQQFIKFCSGFYDFPQINHGTGGKWVDLDPGSQWIKPPGDANTLFIGLASNGNPGSVWFSDIHLYKKNTSTGEATEIPLDNPNFEAVDLEGKPLGWKAMSSEGNRAEMDIDPEVANSPHHQSLRISDTSAWTQQSEHYAHWQPLRGIPIEAGYVYQIKGKLLADEKTRGTNQIQLLWTVTQTTIIDKNALAKEVDSYTQWAHRHQVPLYCGEYGVVGCAPANNKAQWVMELKDLLKGHNPDNVSISRTYHFYRDYQGVADPQKRTDLGLLSAPSGMAPQENSGDTGLIKIIFDQP